MLQGVPDAVYDDLLSRQLQFNPDYYRIVNLAEIEKEEETKEQYGIDATGADPNRKRGSTQPKIEFPVRDHQNSNEMLARPEENQDNSSSGSMSGNEDSTANKVNKTSIIATLLNLDE